MFLVTLTFYLAMHFQDQIKIPSKYQLVISTWIKSEMSYLDDIFDIDI